MKYLINGEYRELSSEEEKEYIALYDSQESNNLDSEYSVEDRLTILEDAFAELCEGVLSDD